MSYCAPGKKKDFTCFSKEDLVYLCKVYNSSNKNRIQLKNKSKKELWISLQQTLKDTCNNERCWINQPIIPRAISSKHFKETFRPEYPNEWVKNPYEWLSSVDIKNVMKQYEYKYKNFLFLGPVPVDCPSSIRCSLTDLEVEDLYNMGKTIVGIIFNLDKHDEPGSHWVACYLDLKNGDLFYFDSVGINPPSMILDFLYKMKKSCQDYFYNIHKHQDVDIYVNNTQFQFGNTECGIFSMYFIISFLKGKDMNNLSKKEYNDTHMNELRKIFYSN